MNILFIYENAINPITGGVERITFLLADYLEKSGCRVFFMGLSDTFENNDPRQVFLPDSKDITSDTNIAFYLDFLKKKNIHTVINKSGMNKNISKLSYNCCNIGIKLVSVIHNSILGTIKNYSSVNKEKYRDLNLGLILALTDLKIVKSLMLFAFKLKYFRHYRALCRNSSNVVIESSNFIEELQFIVGKSHLKNVIAIPNFMVSNNTTVEPKKKEVLFVGRINTSQKRVDLLLKIWQLVHNKFPDWELKIVGDGDELASIKDLSLELNLRNITFFGYQEAASFYKSASILCLTSSYEGFGIVLIEAMSYGAVPMAFNSYLSVTDIIDNAKNGFLITPFNVQEYAESLSDLMSSQKLLKRFSSEAKIKSAEFDLSVVGKKWLDTLSI
jgi:glycosyltransferase involved in cell wall biosynthesis